MKWWLVVGSLFFYPVSAQEFRNNAGSREKHFLYEVKQIDEFFERFNDDPNSLIRSVYKTYNVKFTLDRTKLIKSLFNYETKTWNQAALDAFVGKALPVEMPSGKNWYGENWYAEANCRFQYNKSEITIPVILKIYTDERKRSKWMITAVKPSALKESGDAETYAPAKSQKNKFILPSSHGTNFSELERDFDDKKNLSDYFDNTVANNTLLTSFYNAILQDKIKFMYVKDVKYHFLNVDNYVFTVEYFPRASLNSGWLISSLINATPEEKSKYKQTLLGQ